MALANVQSDPESESESGGSRTQLTIKASLADQCSSAQIPDVKWVHGSI